MKKTVMMAAFAGCVAFSQAATLVGWNLDNTMAVAGPQNSTYTSNGLNAAVLSAGPGVVQVSTGATADAFRLRGWNYTSLAASLTGGDDYIQIALSSQEGYAFTLSSLSMLLYDLDSDTLHVDLRSSADNYATSLGTAATENTTPTSMNVTFNLTGVLDGSYTNVTFRLYGYSDTGNLYTGQPMIGRFNSNDGVTDLQIDGTVGSSGPVPVKATTFVIE